MSWIDVAILALVVLVGVIGIFKGVQKSALSLGAFLVAFILAFFLANVVAEALLSTDGVKTLVLGDGVGENAQWSLANWIYSSGISDGTNTQSFIFTNFYTPMREIVESAQLAIPAEAGVNPVDIGFAMYGAFMMLSAICGVGIFIIVRFLLIIVTVIIKSFIGKKKSAISRVFGFFIGAIRGALWVFAFTVVFSCFGGYNVAGIQAIESEYENNTVVSGFFNEWAYGLRNNLLLPNKDACGRIVELVYKKEVGADPNAEPLPYQRLRLFVGASNTLYETNPWSIKNNKRDCDEAAKSKDRKAGEFEKTGFDTVVQAILDYNKSICEKVDKMSDADLSVLAPDDFRVIADLFDNNSDTDNINLRMDNLWTVLRDYEYYYANFPENEVESVFTSTIKSKYVAVTTALSDLKGKYTTYEHLFGKFPEYKVPDRKTYEDAVKASSSTGEETPTTGEDTPTTGEDASN